MRPLALRVDGQGPVALAFALFVRRLLGPAARLSMDAPAPVPEALATRPIALSHASRLLLERVAPFPAASAPIGRIDIALSGHAGRIRLDAASHGTPALGWVVRHGTLVQALRAALPASDDPFHEPDLHVVADGDTGPHAQRHEHGQSALVAEVHAPDAPPDLAVERFTPEGPLALLPLPGGEAGMKTLVWCAPHALAKARAALSPADFQAALQAAFGEGTGALAVRSAPLLVPLARSLRADTVEGRRVHIGNAAQALHPVAGQGLNLGVRDAWELASGLARGHVQGLPVESVLALHARRRRSDRDTMVAATDFLATGLAHPVLRPVQSALLAVVDALPPLRRAATRGFMGGWPRA